MPGIDEIRRGMIAAWLLLLDRREGLRLLDTGFSGFWRSFLVIVMLSPAYVLYVMAERAILMAELGEDPATGAAFWVERAAVFVIDWAAFPLAAAVLARPLGFSRRYVPLIVAYNWTAPLILLPLILPALLMAMGVIGFGVAAFATMVAIGHVIRYRFIVARMVLDGNVRLAAGLVALELAVSMLLGQLLSMAAGT